MNQPHLNGPPQTLPEIPEEHIRTYLYLSCLKCENLETYSDDKYFNIYLCHSHGEVIDFPQSRVICESFLPEKLTTE